MSDEDNLGDHKPACECVHCRIERAIWQGRDRLPAEEADSLKFALAAHFGVVLAQAPGPAQAMRTLAEFNSDALAVMQQVRANPENAATFARRDAEREALARKPKH